MVCRCQSFNNYYGYDALAISLNRLRGIVFYGLAYGAQGFYYWNYMQNWTSFNGQTTFSDAPVDRNSQENSSIWNIVKTVNEEVKLFSGVPSAGEFTSVSRILIPGGYRIFQFVNS